MASFVGTGLEHGRSRCLDLRKRRPPNASCEVSDEKQADDVTGRSFDRERWFDRLEVVAVGFPRKSGRG